MGMLVVSDDAEAEALLRRALEGREATLGGPEPTTADAMRGAVNKAGAVALLAQPKGRAAIYAPSKRTSKRASQNYA